LNEQDLRESEDSTTGGVHKTHQARCQAFIRVKKTQVHLCVAQGDVYVSPPNRQTGKQDRDHQTRHVRGSDQKTCSRKITTATTPNNNQKDYNGQKGDHLGDVGEKLES